MPTTTTTYSFNKPVVGADEDDWGGYLNGNWDSVDDLLDGTTPVTGIDINSGTLDGVTIGGTTAGAGTFTTLTANTSITGTLATAAQPNITSVGSLTSLDVGGTVTADGLTVEGDAKISATSPTLRITETDTTNVNTRITAGSGNLFIQTENDAENSRTDRLRIDHSTGDISFYEDTGTTAKFFWDASAERLAVGGTTTNATLHVHGNSVISNGNFFSIQSASGLSPELDEASNGWAFTTNGTERMRIDSSGNVGIGTSSPDAKLKVVATGANLLVGYSGTQNYFDASENIFRNFSGTEAMRIDSSGNLLVGKTSTSTTVAGIVLNDDGRLFATGEGGAGHQAARFTRLSNDGDIVTFYKDGTTVGSIGSVAGVDIFVAGSRGAGQRYLLDNILPCNASGTVNDNTLDLGSSAYRYKDLYLSGGVYLGGTGAANKLNSYEEGTWTPAFTDDSGNAVTNLTSLDGRYVKVGTLVYISGSMRTQGISSTSGVSGNLNISGLPFTQTAVQSTGHVSFHTHESSGSYNAPNELPRSSPIVGNTTRIAIYKYSGTGGRTTKFQVTDLNMSGNSNFMFFSGVYETT